MIIRFWTGDSITVSDEVGNKARAAKNAGADSIVLNGNEYSVKDIKRFELGGTMKIKTVHELGMPDLDVPKEIEAAYDKRTIGYQPRKQLDCGE